MRNLVRASARSRGEYAYSLAAPLWPIGAIAAVDAVPTDCIWFAIRRRARARMDMVSWLRCWPPPPESDAEPSQQAGSRHGRGCSAARLELVPMLACRPDWPGQV